MKALPLLLTVSVAISGAGGFLLGKYQAESEFEEIYNLGEAVNLTGRVQTLSMLRKSDIDQAARQLEFLVDTHLIAIEYYKETALDNNDTVILSALKLASLYRNLYHDEYELIKTDDKDVSNVIERALAFGKRHGRIEREHWVEKYLSPEQTAGEDTK